MQGTAAHNGMHVHVHEANHSSPRKHAGSARLARIAEADAPEPALVNHSWGSDFGTARISKMGRVGPPAGIGKGEVRQAALIGTCVSGEFRALDRSWPTWQRYVAGPMGGVHIYFFYLVVARKLCIHTGSCLRSSGPNRAGLGGYSNRVLVGPWALVNDSCVVETALQLGIRFDLWYGEPPLNRRFCSHTTPGHVSYRVVAPDQFANLQMSFRMLTDYEVRWKVRFDWVLRLRTDMLLFTPLPHHAQLAPGAHLVKGMVKAVINDHTALVSRAHAPAYFELAEELRCALNDTTGRYVPVSKLVDNNYLIVSKLLAHRVPIWLLHMGYVLIRPGLPLGEFHYDCWRLLISNAAVPLTNSTPWSWYGNGSLEGRTGSDYGIYFPYCCEHLAPSYNVCLKGWGSFNGTRQLGFSAAGGTHATNVSAAAAATPAAAAATTAVAARGDYGSGSDE